MSIKQMNLVWELQLTANKRIMLLALADIADDEGSNIYPSLERLAWKTEYSKQQVMRLLKALESDGLLLKLRQGVGTGNTNHYQLTLSNGVKKSPFEKSSNSVKLSLLNASNDDSLGPLNESNGDSIESPFADSNSDSTGSQMVTPGASNGDIAESLNPSFIRPLSEEKNPPSLRSAPTGGSERADSAPSAKRNRKKAPPDPPSMGDVMAYAAANSVSGAVAQNWYLDCRKKGWLVGKAQVPVADWQASLLQWNLNEPIFRGPGGAPEEPRAVPSSPADRQRALEAKRQGDELADQREREQRAVDEGLSQLSDGQKLEIEREASLRMPKHAHSALSKRSYDNLLSRFKRDVYRERFTRLNDPLAWRTSSMELEGGPMELEDAS